MKEVVDWEETNLLNQKFRLNAFCQITESLKKPEKKVRNYHSPPGYGYHQPNYDSYGHESYHKPLYDQPLHDDYGHDYHQSQHI